MTQQEQYHKELKERLIQNLSLSEADADQYMKSKYLVIEKKRLMNWPIKNLADHLALLAFIGK
jgi:hypothetical protein